MKVWLASVGDFDDFRVVGVFSTALKAAEAAAFYDPVHGEPNDPIEYTIDEIDTFNSLY